LRGSGGYGYRAPSFHERFFIPLFGNPALEAEQGWSGDIGLDWTPTEKTRLSVTGFYSRFDDLIKLSFTPERIGLFISENVPDARLQGIELEGAYAWNENVSAGVNYTYTDSENVDTGLDLPRRPEQQFRVFSEWRLTAVPVTFGAKSCIAAAISTTAPTPSPSTTPPISIYRSVTAFHGICCFTSGVRT
jgi:outer membrane receptor for ferrienterochelin and colicins